MKKHSAMHANQSICSQYSKLNVFLWTKSLLVPNWHVAVFWKFKSIEAPQILVGERVQSHEYRVSNGWVRNSFRVKAASTSLYSYLLKLLGNWQLLLLSYLGNSRQVFEWVCGRTQLVRYSYLLEYFRVLPVLARITIARCGRWLAPTIYSQ